MDAGITDTLPELGTPAAAVAGIESMLHAAIRLREPFSPLQLRYWLDAYYQARKAVELQEFYDLADRIYREDETPYQPAAPALYDKAGTRASQDAAYLDFTKYMKAVIQKAVKVAGIEIEEGGQEERIATAPAEPRNDRPEADRVGAAETQQTAEPAAKPQRQRPVGWTDGFEPVEIKKGPAAEAAAFKREQFERLQRFLREGVTMQRIVKAAEGNINEDQILGIRECKRVPVAVYRVLEAALDRIETE